MKPRHLFQKSLIVLFFSVGLSQCGNQTPSSMEDAPVASLQEALTPSLATWVDACQATDPRLARLLQAEVMIVPLASIKKTPMEPILTRFEPESIMQLPFL